MHTHTNANPLHQKNTYLPVDGGKRLPDILQALAQVDVVRTGTLERFHDRLEGFGVPLHQEGFAVFPGLGQHLPDGSHTVAPYLAHDGEGWGEKKTRRKEENKQEEN